MSSSKTVRAAMGGSNRWWRLWRVRVLGALVLGFAAFNLLAYNHARAMLFFAEHGERTAPPEALSAPRRAWTLLAGVRIPRPETARSPEHVDLQCEEFSIPVAGEDVTLGAWYCGRDDAPLVVLFHGYADEKSSLLEEAVGFRFSHRASVLLVDFRGSGASSAAYTTVGVDEARDVAAAVGYAREHLVDDDSVLVLFGRSMGASAILRAVSEYGVRADGFVLESVYDDLLHTVQNRFEAMGVPSFPAAQILLFWGGRLADFDAFAHRPVAYAADIHAPLLLLHGAEDVRVTAAQAQRVVDAVPAVDDADARLVFIPGAGHEPLLAAQPETWHAEVEALLERAQARATGRSANAKNVFLYSSENGVVRSVLADATIRMTPRQAERIALEAFPPRDKARLDGFEIVPLRSLLEHWIEDEAWPYEPTLPRSLRDLAPPNSGRAPADPLPDDPYLDVPQYIVRGSFLDETYHPGWRPKSDNPPRHRKTFHALVDGHNGTLRALQCGEELWTTTSKRTTLALASQHAQYALITPVASVTPNRRPTEPPSFDAGRRLLDGHPPLELANAGPQLRTTLELFPLWPGRRWTVNHASSMTGCSSWQQWEESIEVVTVADARLLSPELALVRLDQRRTAVEHGERRGRALEARLAASSSHEPMFIVVWRDEVYEARDVPTLRAQLEFLERPVIPTVAPRSHYGWPIERPIPILRLPLTPNMARFPSEGGGNWSLPTPEPPWSRDPLHRPCMTIYTHPGNATVWRTFCEGIGWAEESFLAGGSSQARSLRELVEVQVGTRR